MGHPSVPRGRIVAEFPAYSRGSAYADYEPEALRLHCRHTLVQFAGCDGDDART